MLTKSISRFARNTVDLLETVRHLKEIGVEVWFERENIHSLDGDGDPTCGSAGMLISSIAYLKEKGQEWRNVSLYGQELNQLTAAIGKMNLFLRGLKDFRIVNDDTLSRPAFVEHGQIKTFNERHF